MNILNNKGARIDPWGTPLYKEIHLPRAFPMLLFAYEYTDNWLPNGKQIHQGLMPQV